MRVADLPVPRRQDPRRRARRRVVAFLLLPASVAACTTSEPGVPTTSAEAGGETTGPTSSTKPTVALPARPRDLKLDAVDPCKLLTDPQLDQLKIKRVHPWTYDQETYRGAKGCVSDVSEESRRYEYSALLVTTEGVEAWLTGKRNVESEAVEVDDYGAARYRLTGDGPNSAPCTTALDVAQGQQLQVTTSTTGKDFSQDEVCRMSEKAANLVLTTLKTLA
ncbi:DUF3558 domain-containing protein [Actinokineospora globicatena]|uniref:DUF3558 domain-containing protein n=1 Tax=Actinokineospora globicatena TaxID=103729 RepID=UPI0025533DCE|nr:DUF3558 domain-containing protein [Actinokineospora globicatena]